MFLVSKSLLWHTKYIQIIAWMYYTSTSYVLLCKLICNGSHAENVRQRF